MPLRITCIRKASGNYENPYTAITNFGWIEDGEDGHSGNITRDRMFEFINDGGKAYVNGVNGEKAFLVASITEDGIKIVYPDPENPVEVNMFGLKECV